MRQISFTIHGNQDSRSGNPLGYKRTLNHSWRADSTRYVKWCEYVRRCYYQHTLPESGKMTWQEYSKLAQNMPLTTSRNNPARMDIQIEFASDVRPDPDNVFKGIADALFENDKYLSGSFDYSYAKEGRVLVKITFKN